MTLMATALAVPGVLTGANTTGHAVAAAKPLEIVLTNDDGPTASGSYLTAMRDTLCAAGHHVTVIVPATDQSGNGTRITGVGTLSAATSTFRCGAGTGTQYAVSASSKANASPADAVLFGLHVVFARSRPDLVVSGINPGSNAGRITNHSGTVGAAVTAIEEGVPAIAVSIEYDAADAAHGLAGATAAQPDAAAFVTKLIARLQQTQRGATLLSGGLNVNWPIAYDRAGLTVVPPKGAKLTRIGTGEAILISYQALPGGTYAVVPGICGLPTSCAGDTRDDADMTAINGNWISVSALDGDWSAHPSAALAKRLKPLLG
jgi:5'-nucleotidase